MRTVRTGWMFGRYKQNYEYCTVKTVFSLSKFNTEFLNNSSRIHIFLKVTEVSHVVRAH